MKCPEDVELKQMAIEFWQDDLAKFFPKSPGPTNTEVVMFKAGYLKAVSDALLAGSDTQNADVPKK